ncbi:MAG: hypothetical protein AAF089_01675 [Bacteroidota bacterium]
MSLNIKTISAKDAKNKLSELRSGRGGRTSKYHPVLEAVQGRRGTQVVTLDNLSPNEVQGLRAYLYRYLDSEEWTVKSARTDDSGNNYRVFVGRDEDFG